MASAVTDAAKSALGSYTALGSQDAMNTANTNYDVGGSTARLSALKGIVGNLQNSVEAVDPSVTGRTSGTFTTEGQRQALVAKEQAPILGSLNKQQSAYSSEQQDNTQKQALASQMAAALLSDDKSKYQRLLDQYNQSSAQDAADEQRRQADVQAQQFQQTLAENKRQADLQNSQASASLASKAASSAASTPSTSQFLVQAFSGYDPKKMKNYTEQEVIPALMANYNLSKTQAATLAYQYRKSVFNE